ERDDLAPGPDGIGEALGVVADVGADVPDAIAGLDGGGERGGKARLVGLRAPPVQAGQDADEPGLAGEAAQAGQGLEAIHRGPPPRRRYASARVRGPSRGRISASTLSMMWR